MAAPEAPQPQSVPHPQPRVLWTDPSGRLRLCARDWADSHPASYAVLARHAQQWQPATGEEVWRLLCALAAWLDSGPRREAPGEDERREGRTEH